MLEPLAAANPLEARYQSNLADCYSEIASIQAQAGTIRREPGPARESQSHRERLDRSIPG